MSQALTLRGFFPSAIPFRFRRNFDQSATLAELPDTPLQKLFSGEIRVKQAA